MAGDWFPVRLNIATDPAVIFIAAQCLITDLDVVVGKLVKVWSWANENTNDGNAHGVTEKWLDAYIGVTGFAQAMKNVRPNPWLTVNSDGISFPNFDRWNGKSAKLRLQTALRVQKHRNASSVTNSLPQKRREESNTPPNPPATQGGTGFAAQDVNSEKVVSRETKRRRPPRVGSAEWRNGCRKVAEEAQAEIDRRDGKLK